MQEHNEISLDDLLEEERGSELIIMHSANQDEEADHIGWRLVG